MTCSIPSSPLSDPNSSLMNALSSFAGVAVFHSPCPDHQKNFLNSSSRALILVSVESLRSKKMFGFQPATSQPTRIRDYRSERRLQSIWENGAQSPPNKTPAFGVRPRPRVDRRCDAIQCPCGKVVPSHTDWRVHKRADRTDPHKAFSRIQVPPAHE